MQRIGRVICGLIAGSIVLLYALVWYVGIYFNISSNSLPYGIYYQVKRSPLPGDLVASCLTQKIADYGIRKHYLEKGICDTGIQYVLKRVIASEGDVITIKNNQLYKNNYQLKGYPIWQKDGFQQPIERLYNLPYLLHSGEYWLMSSYHLYSWDSRYFGAVPVEFVLQPLWIFDF